MGVGAVLLESTTTEGRSTATGLALVGATASSASSTRRIPIRSILRARTARWVASICVRANGVSSAHAPLKASATSSTGKHPSFCHPTTPKSITARATTLFDPYPRATESNPYRRGSHTPSKARVVPSRSLGRRREWSTSAPPMAGYGQPGTMASPGAMSSRIRTRRW